MNNDLMLSKAKTLEGKWVEGYIQPLDFKCTKWTMVTKWQAGVGGIRNEIDPDTVCKSTGKKDLNEHRVYTGDWWHEEENSRHFIYIVDYSVEKASFVVNWYCGISPSNYDDSFQDTVCLDEFIWGEHDVTIEGNIHDRKV